MELDSYPKLASFYYQTLLTSPAVVSSLVEYCAALFSTSLIEKKTKVKYISITIWSPRHKNNVINFIKPLIKTQLLFLLMNQAQSFISSLKSNACSYLLDPVSLSSLLPSVISLTCSLFQVMSLLLLKFKWHTHP